MRLRATRLTGMRQGPRVFYGILDQLSVAAQQAASDSRLLRRDYFGLPLIRVRRSSDNAEANFSHSEMLDASGNYTLNTTALLAFCGAASGFLVTRYDQSGNNRHFTQATPALQPSIVTNGVLETGVGGRPAAFFNGSGVYLDAITTPFGGQNLTVNNVVRINTAANSSIYSRSLSLGAPPAQSWATPGHVTLLVNGASLKFGVENADAGYMLGVSASSTYVFGAPFVYTFEASPTLHRGVFNGTPTGPFLPLTAPDVWSFTTIRVGRECAPGAITFLNGCQPESVLFASNSPADRQVLERNQGAYYGISVA